MNDSQPHTDGPRTIADTGGPRILLVSNSRKIGGGATCLLTFANALRECGLEPVVVHPEPGVVFDLFTAEGHVNELAPGAQPAWREPIRTYRDLRGWQRLLDDHTIDVVHANDPSTARSVSLACGAAGVPFLCHVHFPVEEAYAAWVFRRLPKPSAFAFCSAALQAETAPGLARHYPDVPQHVVYNALDCDRFAPPADVAPRSRPVVGIVAHLVRVKGHEDFLAMAAALTERGIDAEYRIAGTEGESGWESYLRSRAAALGIDNRVRFLGHLDDVPGLLGGLDVLVCASHVEPFGRCLIEANACEVPVVATRVGGIPEAVAENETALLVPPREPGRLADAVDRLLGDEILRSTMGRAGRRRVLERFGPEAQVDHCLGIYAEMKGVRT